MKKLKDQSFNAQNRRSSEMFNRIFDTYKKSVMARGKSVFKIVSDVDMAIMCSYPPSKYALPHCKCVFHCCAYFSCIDIPSPESDQHY